MHHFDHFSNSALRRILRFGAVCCLMLTLATLARAEEEEGEGSTVPTSETQARVTVVPLREGTLPLTLRALGRIGATRQTPATVAARAAGIVEKIAVRDGEAVTSGTVLLHLDPREAQAELQKAQSDLALAQQELSYTQASGLTQQQEELDLAARQARVKAEQAQRESERMAALLAKKLVSEKAATEARQEAETSRSEADAAERKAALYKKTGRGLDVERLRAKVVEAQAALRLAEIESDAMTVRSPLAGRVTRVHATLGQSVEKGAALVELEARGGVGVSFALAPAQARRIRPAMEFALRDEATTQSFSGKIIAVGAGVDPESGLVRVEGALALKKDDAAPYAGEVLPGEIVTGLSPRGLIAPESALSVTDEGTFIHVVDGSNKAHQAAVKVVALSNKEALVTGDGLKAGEPVISDGNYNLPDGAGVVKEQGKNE